ncbi:hypothetical protein MSIMFI_03679 [Mycobacterium simulans]|nr:hypothetical protein MSIMFI_03679 [Mycobacterium simulans]
MMIWPTLARNGCFAVLAMLVALNGQFGVLLTFFVIVMLALWPGPAGYRHWKAPRHLSTGSRRRCTAHGRLAHDLPR